ncbi:MAG: hypothetical protein LBS99_05865, partial [Clostridiales bacterium]|nr:hypothetical protein [Clostridiales bacterium]
MPKGYMYDADGNASRAVEYALAADGNGYYLTVTADADFFETAAYPVVIDPTIEATIEANWELCGNDDAGTVFMSSFVYDAPAQTVTDYSWVFASADEWRACVNYNNNPELIKILKKATVIDSELQLSY